MAETEKKIQQEKLDAVAVIKDRFKGINDFIITDYRGLSVEEITKLRVELREKKAEFRVMKNRFVKIALKDTEYPEVDEYLKGPTAIALTREDSGSVAKILFDYASKTKLEIKGGVIDGVVFNSESVESFSKLPSRNDLISMLMSTMNAPVQNFVYVLNGVTEKLARTLKAVADSKQGN